MDLSSFNNTGFSRGASVVTEGTWLVVSSLLVSTWLPGSSWRTALLRLFGARIGTGVNIKPGVKIKFPWKLRVGDYTWIGENVWIDNIAFVRIGSNVCISQGVYLCTGSHDWSSKSFDLRTGEIEICNEAWLGAFSKVSLGVTVGEGAVSAFGTVVSKSLEPWMIHGMSGTKPVRARCEKG